MKFPAKLIGGVILLAGGLASSGCMTEKVARVASSGATQAPISLRVEHCYVNPAGHLVVAGEGGVCQENLNATPRAPIWFQANMPALAKIAKDNTVVLPQAVLHAGAPEPAWLEQEHFSELPFAEYAYDSDTPMNPLDNICPTAPLVKIVYWDTLWTKNFPDRLGHRPDIVVQNNPAVPPIRIQVMDVRDDSNYAALLLLPAAAAVDTVTAGAVVAGSMPGVTAVAVAWSRVDHNWKEGDQWLWRPWK